MHCRLAGALFHVTGGTRYIRKLGRKHGMVRGVGFQRTECRGHALINRFINAVTVLRSR